MPSREPEAIKVLLASDDIQSIETICDCLQRISILVETSCDSETATGKLCRAKFEGVIVDLLERESGFKLLRQVRQLTSHKAAVIFAILGHSSERAAAFGAGANFVLERPLHRPVLIRTFKAAYALLVRERRRYARCPWETKVRIVSSSGQQFDALSLNISESGIAILAQQVPRVGERLQLQFQLPEFGELSMAGDVCWTDGSGRAGIHFVQVARPTEAALQSWIEVQLHGLIPSD